jgi:hypothetical protein
MYGRLRMRFNMCLSLPLWGRMLNAQLALYCFDILFDTVSFASFYLRRPKHFSSIEHFQSPLVHFESQLLISFM